MDSNFCKEFYRCRGNTLTMCTFHESTCNGFGDIWWTDKPIYFSSIDVPNIEVYYDIQHLSYFNQLHPAEEIERTRDGWTVSTGYESHRNNKI